MHRSHDDRDSNRSGDDGIMEGFAGKSLGKSMDCDYYGPDNIPEMVLLAESAF
jgi:hypothetical protein